MRARIYLRPETVATLDEVVSDPRFAADHFAAHHVDMTDGDVSYIEVENEPSHWVLWRVECLIDTLFGRCFMTVQSTPEQFEQEKRQHADL